MKILLTIVLFNLISDFIVTHLQWMTYANQESTGEYYRHPIFEPDIFDRRYIPIRFIFASLLGFTSAFLGLVFFLEKADALSVYIDCFGQESENKKKWWRFWRWGIHLMPKSMSPLPKLPKLEDTTIGGEG